MDIIKKLSGPLAALIVWMILKDQIDNQAAILSSIITCMALWWMTEAYSIYFTALIPVVAFPIFGILKMGDVASTYLPQISFLFIGGFMLAYAVEKWELHKRIAYLLLIKAGKSPAKVLFGFMMISWALSMWILNTATVIMLIPMATAIISQSEKMDGRNKNGFSQALLIGIAYASSIGGMATLIGTAPNLFLMEFFNENYQNLTPISFVNWFSICMPLSLLLVFLCYGVLHMTFLRTSKNFEFNIDFCRKKLVKMGKMKYEEKIIVGLFSTTIILWFTARDFDIGSFHFTGWFSYFDWVNFMHESTIAMISAILLFLIPSRTEKNRALITWEEVKKLPLGILFLFGSGFALAKGFNATGLDKLIAVQLSSLSSWSPFMLVFILCLFMTFFTELTSNTASVALIVPILAVVCLETEIHPLKVLLPVTLSASCAFMLPIATPPNTIVYATEKLKISQMMKSGFVMNLLSVPLITGITWLILNIFMEI